MIDRHIVTQNDTWQSYWLVRISTPWSGPWNYGHWLRRIWPGFLELMQNFWHLLTGKWRWNRVLEFQTTPKANTRCYCMAGSRTDLRFVWSPFFVWISRGRFPLREIPCPCDEAMHKLFHEGEDCGCAVQEEKP